MLCCLIKESILDKLVQMTTTMQPREECPSSRTAIRTPGRAIRTRNLCGRMGCKLDANSNPPITLSLFLGVIRTEVSQQRERATFRRRRHCKIERERSALYCLIPRESRVLSSLLPSHLFADRSHFHSERASERATSPRGN